MTLSFPSAGRIVFQDSKIFSSWRSSACKNFIEKTFVIDEVRQVEISTTNGQASISYVSEEGPGAEASMLRKLASLYRRENGPQRHPVLEKTTLQLLPKTQPSLRIYRYGSTLSTWEPRLQTKGWARLRNPLILNKRHYAQFVERELMNLIGVARYEFHASAGSVSIEYDSTLIHLEQIVQHLDRALSMAPTRSPKVKSEGASLPVATLSLVTAAASTFFVPAMLPASAALMLYTAIPSYRRGYQVVTQERRLGVDVLDSIIFSACLVTGQLFAGATTAWFLTFGRKLLKKTEDDSAKILRNVFGKQPSLVWLFKDGAEIETSLDKIRLGDLIVVHTGEAVPVDGKVHEGNAIIDQHMLTGESAPSEKAVGDDVFASTVMLAGKIVVAVEKAGEETTSSKITRILNQTVTYKPKSQSIGENLADKAVLPALGIASIAGLTTGPSAALAVINSELGTGIRMAAPLGLLSALTLCAKDAILVKDGQALERMREVDTVLFDKTGTLTREKPEVGKILCCGSFDESLLISYAAAAEQKFSHPIAKAIQERFEKLQRPMPQINASRYSVGFGITVEIEGELVRVGSRRFMEMENIPFPTSLQKDLSRIHDDGHSFVSIAIGDKLAGILELRSSNRPEAQEIITGLRARGIKQIAIISGDHERPTRALAEQLGVDRHFAEVLPQEKARYVELLQKEGRTVCFVGDGINDSIALKQADVSISLRGASSVATDTAQVIFMEDNITKMLALFDHSQMLHQNVRRSWNLILGPNAFCVAGVFLFGFNIWHSVAFNNISALMALANGVLPLRRANTL